MPLVTRAHGLLNHRVQSPTPSQHAQFIRILFRGRENSLGVKSSLVIEGVGESEEIDLGAVLHRQRLNRRTHRTLRITFVEMAVGFDVRRNGGYQPYFPGIARHWITIGFLTKRTQ